MKISITKVVILTVFGLLSASIGYGVGGASQVEVGRCHATNDTMRVGFQEALAERADAVDRLSAQLEHARQFTCAPCLAAPAVCGRDQALIMMLGYMEGAAQVYLDGPPGRHLWKCTRQ